MQRFGEFLAVLRPIIDGDASTRTTLDTAHYTAVEAPSTPGAVQSPLPLTMAAGGAKGLRLAAMLRAGLGHHRSDRDRRRARPSRCSRRYGVSPPSSRQPAAQGRDPSTLGRVLLWTPIEPVLTSIGQFDELVAPYVELGFDQFVLHHPEQTGPYGGSCRVFEDIASKYPPV